MKISKWFALAVPAAFLVWLSSCDVVDTSKTPPKLMLVKPEYYDSYKSNQKIPFEIYAKDLNGLKNLSVEVRRLVPDTVVYSLNLDLTGKTEYTLQDTFKVGVYLPHKTAAVKISLSASNEKGIERSGSTQFNVNP